MKWPWVHVARVESAERSAADLAGMSVRILQERDRAEAQLVSARARIDELTGEILRMRREGFVPQPEPPKLDVGPQMPDKVLAAIEDRAFNPAMRRQLRTVAERMQREGTDESKIVEAILEGEQFEDEPTTEGL